jgi:hypothetical protein
MGSRLAVAIVVGAMALGASQAAGEPQARSAVANSLVATISDITPAEDVGRRPSAQISGQILAKKKFASRRCRVSRHPQAQYTRLSGRAAVIDFFPTNKAGRVFATFPLEYGGNTSDGFTDGDVPFSGGTVSFNLVIQKAKVQKSPGSLRSTTCRPLSQQLSITIPPSVFVD